jgi:hypothetical protein
MNDKDAEFIYTALKILAPLMVIGFILLMAAGISAS